MLKSLNSDNWEPEFMTIFVTWQLRVTLDSNLHFLRCSESLNGARRRLGGRKRTAPPPPKKRGDLLEMQRQSCRWKTICETLLDKETSKMTVLKREEQLTPKVCLTIYKSLFKDGCICTCFVQLCSFGWVLIAKARVEAEKPLLK